jgi:glycosyltransferase involved in cell wall biosynthesis
MRVGRSYIKAEASLSFFPSSLLRGMKILIFSLAPVFSSHVHGGSQKILREIAIHLGARGHEVRILCVRRPDNEHYFMLAESVAVVPTFRLKPTYPEPYYTAPGNLANMIVAIRRNLDWCDRFYIHDGELPFQDLYDGVPTVVSFRDFVYPDTLVGGFTFRRDRLLLNSEYVARCVFDAFSRFLPGLPERTIVIPNGVDLSHFFPRMTSCDGQLQQIMGRIPPATYTLLYPHRPDARKGIFESITVTAKLQQRLRTRGKSVRLLIPVWMDSDVAAQSHTNIRIFTNTCRTRRWNKGSQIECTYMLGFPIT